MKRRKNLLSLMLVAILALTAMVSPASASDIQSTNTEDQTAQILDYTENYIAEANEEYYTFQGFEGNVNFVEVNENNFIADISATMHMTLKATKADELPAVKAMLDTVNVPDKVMNARTAVTEVTLFEAVEKNNENFSEAQSVQAATEIYGTLESVNKCIGESNDFNYSFKMVGSFENGELVVDKFLFLEGLEDYFDAEVIVRDSYDEIYEETEEAFVDSLENISPEKEKRLTRAIIYSPYDRTKARDYAIKYSSNPYSYRQCSACGSTTCPSKTYTYYYNPAYTNYGHNDCMNFVSQALNYGGVARTSAWSPGTPAWISCTKFYNTMYGSHIYSSNFTNAGAGFIKLLRDSGYTSTYKDYAHAELIVLNDTVNRQSAAHSKDKIREVYTSAGSYDYYGVYTSIYIP